MLLIIYLFIHNCKIFVSTHYAGEDLAIKFGQGEPWKKVIGPVFVYLNSNAAAKENPSILWNDAKTRVCIQFLLFYIVSISVYVSYFSFFSPFFLNKKNNRLSLFSTLSIKHDMFRYVTILVQLFRYLSIGF